MDKVELKDIEFFLRKKISEVLQLEVEGVEVDQPFESFGIESITAVRMVGELEDYLDIDLPSSLLWDYFDIKHLAEHLYSLKNN